MLENYKTIYAGGEGEITEKKSRFIATVRLVEKEEDALAFIEEMKKKYWDARHNCYAYSIGEHREFTRCRAVMIWYTVTWEAMPGIRVAMVNRLRISLLPGNLNRFST